MKNTQRFIFRMVPSDRKKLDALAKAEDRSIAWIIRDAIRQRYQETFGQPIKQSK